MDERQFKRLIKELEKIKGQGTELISLYIAPGSNVAEISNRLRYEYSQASNIKSKQTRKNVQAAIERILQTLKGVHKPPENGAAIFCGNVDGKIELYTVIPPYPITVQIYRCDSRFFLDPLKEMLKPRDVYGLIVMDRREATFGYLKGKNVEIVKHFTSNVPGKHRKGGQSAMRFQRLIEDAVNEFFTKVGETMNELFGDKEIKGIIFGGPGPTKHSFLSGDYIHDHIRKKIVGIVDTSYTDEFGIKELVDKSGEILEHLEIAREKKLLDRFFKAVMEGKAVYGEEDVRKAIYEGKAEIILISEALEWYRVLLKCPNCGYEEQRTVKDLESFEKEKHICPKCGTEMVIEEKKDLGEEIAELAESIGANVEYVGVEITEGKQFLDGFGGIGAILRW